MNRKAIIAYIFLASVVFVSCKKELQPQESSETPLTETKVTENQNVAQPMTVPNPNAQTIQAPNPVQTQATPTAPGMNPPHGQPNHRCDIAVGAPLNSPKSVTPAPPTSQGKATITPVDMTSGTTAVNPKMNPPHGQEGHRCDIAVGAPLPKV